ncbi:hypothetical protein [Cerasicoccus maritimus]|uniref:hypothetical protein n=1 Tax=Cerasicoccus maritimus TaxID=490089 RepID=UPI002852CC4F|nr:hypothetical protein [Cerasicoccus maritimus]
MGLFDKVKSMKDAVTGGGAKVFAQAEAPVLGQPFTVTITASSTGADVKYDRVYLKVRGIEYIDMHDNVSFSHDGQSHNKSVHIKKSTTTFEQEFNVAPAGVLPGSATEGWTIDVQLPENAMPSFRGRYARHYYAIFAGLDCFGNDPDSGWIELHMQ